MPAFKQLTSISIDDVDLDVEFSARTTLISGQIDWSVGAIFKLTLIATTSITFVNYSTSLNKVITILATGDYSLSFPSNVKIISGAYDGKVMNYIQIHCVENVKDKEEFWCTISQATPND